MTTEQQAVVATADTHEAETFAPLDSAPSDVNEVASADAPIDPNQGSDIQSSEPVVSESASTAEVQEPAANAETDTQASAEAFGINPEDIKEVAAEEARTWRFIDGDKDLLAYLAAVEERNEPTEARLVQALTAELKQDQKLRIRFLDCIEVANTTMEDVKSHGQLVKTNGGEDLLVPAGYGQDPITLFTDMSVRLLNLIEGEDNKGKAEAILNVMTHRAALLTAPLLNLRRIYSIHNQAMHPRVSAMFQNVIADATQMTDGTFPHVDSQMKDLKSPEWTYTQLPQQSGEHNTGHVNYLVHYAGQIMPVTLFSYSLVEQVQPDPSQPPSLAMILDHDLQIIVTQSVQVIGVRDIGCWRLPTEEDAKNYSWKTSEEVANSYHVQYQATLAMAKQQEQQASASPLILPETKLQLLT